MSDSEDSELGISQHESKHDFGPGLDNHEEYLTCLEATTELLGPSTPFEDLASDVAGLMFQFLRVGEVCRLARVSKRCETMSALALSRRPMLLCPPASRHRVDALIRKCPRVKRVVDDNRTPLQVAVSVAKHRAGKQPGQLPNLELTDTLLCDLAKPLAELESLALFWTNIKSSKWMSQVPNITKLALRQRRSLVPCSYEHQVLLSESLPRLTSLSVRGFFFEAPEKRMTRESADFQPLFPRLKSFATPVFMHDGKRVMQFLSLLPRNLARLTLSQSALKRRFMERLASMFPYLEEVSATTGSWKIPKNLLHLFRNLTSYRMRLGHEITKFIAEQKELGVAPLEIFPRMDKFHVCSCVEAAELVLEAFPDITRLQVGLYPASTTPMRNLSPAIFEFRNLVHLQISGFQLPDQALQLFANFRRLRALKLSGELGDNPESLRVFGAALAHTGIRALALTRCLPCRSYFFTWVECIETLLSEVRLPYLHIRLRSENDEDLSLRAKVLSQKFDSNPTSLVVHSKEHSYVNGTIFPAEKKTSAESVQKRVRKTD